MAVNPTSTVRLAEALGLSDTGLFALAPLIAFALGAAAGAMRRYVALLSVLGVSVLGAVVHARFVAPPLTSAPILPPIAASSALARALFVAGALGLRASRFLTRLRRG